MTSAGNDPWPGYVFPAGPGDNLPDGFVLTEISPGQWQLEVPVGDLVAFHLDATDPVALRRAAFGIANLRDGWFLPQLVNQITAVLGDEAEGEVAFTAAFDPFEVDVAGWSGWPGFLEGPRETHRKVNRARAAARRLGEIFGKEATS